MDLALGGKGDRYIFVTFAAAKLEDFGVVADEGDAFSALVESWVGGLR